MPTNRPWRNVSGPFRSHQLREGDDYELSNGHAIRRKHAGGRHGRAHSIGAAVLSTDPALTQCVGLHVGISFNDDKNLRAPDIVVGLDLREHGWATVPPPLVVEYADEDEDEDELADKIEELLTFGTKIIWVVRFVGPLRVEIHEPGRPVRFASADDVLRADGILQNPVPVRALVERENADNAMLLNILNGKGFRDLEHYLAETRAKARAAALKADEARGEANGIAQSLAEMRALLHAQIASRGWTLAPSLDARIAACTELPTFARWLIASATAVDVEVALR